MTDRNVSASGEIVLEEGNESHWFAGVAWLTELLPNRIRMAIVFSIAPRSVSPS